MTPLFYFISIIPVVIAWLLTMIFIKLYLSPRRKRKILINAAKVFIHEDVLSTILKQQVTDKDAFNRLASLIEQHVDEFLTIRLLKEMPYLSMLMGDKSLALMKKIFMRELETLFPEVMNRYIEDVLDQEQVQALATKQMAALTPGQVQAVFKPFEKAFMSIAIMVGLAISAVQVLALLFFNSF